MKLISGHLACLAQWFIALVLLTTEARSQDAKNFEIPIESAAQRVGDMVALVFEVKSGHTMETSPMAFLNSKENHQEADNFAVVIKGVGYYRFKRQGIDDPGSHFVGKKIRVSGTVSLHLGRPEIIVTRPQQIEVIAQKG